jgi:hypothetical protein
LAVFRAFSALRLSISPQRLTLLPQFTLVSPGFIGKIFQVFWPPAPPVSRFFLLSFLKTSYVSGEIQPAFSCVCLYFSTKSARAQVL